MYRSGWNIAHTKTVKRIEKLMILTQDFTPMIHEEASR